MADLRKIALAISIIGGVLTLKLFKFLGSWSALDEEDQDRKRSLESMYQYVGLVACYMIISGGVSRYLYPRDAEGPLTFCKYFCTSLVGVIILNLSIFIFNLLPPLW